MRISDWSSDVCSSDLPIEANRLLPLVLTAITTVFIYRLAVRLCPIPLAGLLAATFVNIELWMKDDLTSGTPRAFFTPLTAMFLHGLAQRNIVLTALSAVRSEEHTSELQSLMRISYAVFCLKNKKQQQEARRKRSYQKQQDK